MFYFTTINGKIKMKVSKMTFANNLKNLRAMKCISQAKLADVFGFTQQAVGRWEQGQFTPDYDTLVKLSKFFNVSTDYLLGRSDSPTGSYSADIGSPSKKKYPHPYLRACCCRYSYRSGRRSHWLGRNFEKACRRWCMFRLACLWTFHGAKNFRRRYRHCPSAA